MKRITQAQVHQIRALLYDHDQSTVARMVGVSQATVSKYGRGIRGHGGSRTGLDPKEVGRIKHLLKFHTLREVAQMVGRSPSTVANYSKGVRPRSFRHTLPRDLIGRMRAARRAGHTYQAIADAAGVSLGAVYRYTKEVRDDRDCSGAECRVHGSVGADGSSFDAS